MVKPSKGAVLLSTLIFISLSSLLVTQVAEAITQVNKLMFAFHQQRLLTYLADNKTLEWYETLVTRYAVLYQQAQSLDSSSRSVTNFSDLPSCQTLTHNKELNREQGFVVMEQALGLVAFVQAQTERAEVDLVSVLCITSAIHGWVLKRVEVLKLTEVSAEPTYSESVWEFIADDKQYDRLKER